MWYGRAVRNTASVVILLNLSSRAFPLRQLLRLLVPQFLHPFSSVQFSCSVVSDSLPPHEL